MISITTDQPFYDVNSFIHVSVIADPEGTPAQWAFARLLFSAPLTDLKHIDRSAPPEGWGSRALCQAQDGFADLWAYGVLDGTPDAPAPLTADLWLWTTAPGSLDLHFDPGFTAGFELFGQPLAPYHTVVQIVPEPGVGLLLLAGLALAAWWRR